MTVYVAIISVCAQVHSELQMRLALSVLLLTTKSQNMGHAQHVGFDLCLVVSLFKSLCFIVCVWVGVWVCVCIVCFAARICVELQILTCSSSSSLFLSFQGFEPECLYTGENFGKVLTTLLAVNFATQGKSFAVWVKKHLNSIKGGTLG